MTDPSNRAALVRLLNSDEINQSERLYIIERTCLDDVPVFSTDELLAFLEHRDEVVRAGGAYALRLDACCRLADIFRDLAQNDPSEAVRKLVAGILEEFTEDHPAVRIHRTPIDGWS
jgi:hypothetical protein